MLCNEIGWHDLQIRQVSGNLQIVQCNLKIGQIGRLDGTYPRLADAHYKEAAAFVHINFQRRHY